MGLFRQEYYKKACKYIIQFYGKFKIYLTSLSIHCDSFSISALRILQYAIINSKQII